MISLWQRQVEEPVVVQAEIPAELGGSNSSTSAMRAQESSPRLAEASNSWSDKVISLSETYEKSFKEYIDTQNKANEMAENSPEFQELRSLQMRMSKMSDDEARKLWDEEDRLSAAVDKVEKANLKKLNVDALYDKQNKAFTALDKFLSSTKGIDTYLKLAKKKNPTKAEIEAMKIFNRVTYNPD